MLYSRSHHEGPVLATLPGPWKPENAHGMRASFKEVKSAIRLRTLTLFETRKLEAMSMEKP